MKSVFLGFKRGSTQLEAKKEGGTQWWVSTELAPRSGIAGKVLESCQGMWDSELSPLGLLLPTEPPPGSLPGSQSRPSTFWSLAHIILERADTDGEKRCCEMISSLLLCRGWCWRVLYTCMCARAGGPLSDRMGPPEIAIKAWGALASPGSSQNTVVLFGSALS